MTPEVSIPKSRERARGAPIAGRRRRSRSELEEERDFLLASLRDLESEHGAGDLDEEDYATLKESYTRRAAAVLRSLAGPDTDAPDGDRLRTGGPAAAVPIGRQNIRGRRRLILTVAGLLALGIGIGSAVAAASSHRVAGENITGQNVGPSEVARQLQAARNAEVDGDAVTELEDLRAILAEVPTQPEALTLEGWLLAQTQQPKLLAQGIGLLRLAVQVDPGLSQTHAYLAIALLSRGDDRGAVPELRWYLDHHPDPTLAPKMRVALAKAEQALRGP